jgi:hypothetical protein
VAREDDLHVGEFEAELFHVGADDRDGALKAGVYEDMTAGGGDEIGGKTFGSDVIEVACNAVRREGLVPIILGEERES